MTCCTMNRIKNYKTELSVAAKKNKPLGKMVIKKQPSKVLLTR
jgi:hypothetical protein